jgi:hypothetical protein
MIGITSLAAGALSAWARAMQAVVPWVCTGSRFDFRYRCDQSTCYSSVAASGHETFWVGPFWVEPFWVGPFWVEPFWGGPFWVDRFWGGPFWGDRFWVGPFWGDRFWIELFWAELFWIEPSGSNLLDLTFWI